MKERNKFYFTFGSDKDYPYQNTYLIVIADCMGEAMTKFTSKYPNRHFNCINCAFYYDEATWNKSIKLFYPKEPAEIIE